MNPTGKLVVDWTGDWMNNYFYPFTFAAATPGSYRMDVTHFSLYPKDLTLQVTPAGWTYAGIITAPTLTPPPLVPTATPMPVGPAPTVAPPPPPATVPASPVPQTIKQTMPVGDSTGAVISYTRTLQAGETVTGLVQLTGAPQSRDASWVWRFQVIGPTGQLVVDWTGDWMRNFYHPFTFTAAVGGLYRLDVTHYSLYPKDLLIQVTPTGWT